MKENQKKPEQGRRSGKDKPEKRSGKLKPEGGRGDYRAKSGRGTDDRFSKPSGGRRILKSKPETGEGSGRSGDSGTRQNRYSNPAGGRRILKSKPEAGAGGGRSGDSEMKQSRYSKPSGERRIKKPKSEAGEGGGRSGDSGMRLNRYIANAGVCSRREADKYILAGLVTVNGKTVNELGVKVRPDDEVRFDGRRLNPEKKVYLLLNKPKNYVTTTEDPHAEQTVMDLVKDACAERIYPVGRLDKGTTGVLLFTNDGEMSKKLTHPRHNMKKIYQVTLDMPLSKRDMNQIAEGVELEDGMIAADTISYVDPVNKAEIGIEIHSGRNRIVRRIFEHLGYKVKKLDRVLFAGLTKKNVPRGKYRFLTEKEIQFLKMQ